MSRMPSVVRDLHESEPEVVHNPDPSASDAANVKDVPMWPDEEGERLGREAPEVAGKAVPRVYETGGMDDHASRTHNPERLPHWDIR